MPDIGLLGAPSTCPVALEKQILLENIGNQVDEWKPEFINQMDMYHYKHRAIKEKDNTLVFDKEWKKRIFISYKIKDNDLWVYYKISFHFTVKILILLIYSIIFITELFLFLWLYIFGIYSGMFPSFNPIFMVLIIVIPIYTILFSVLIPIFTLKIPYQFGKIKNEKIIILSFSNLKIFSVQNHCDFFINLSPI